MKYRPEIDGLRALAVVPVILFHAGFGLFSGGFVGVPVFFVISGYLITTILLNDIEAKRFSIVKFYERRARRILPALFLMMLACLPFAWFWLTPVQAKDFAQSLIAVALFSSNFLFWQESGYFGAAAADKPLLHTWSLAVEEQYYVLFPIFLMLAWRFGRKRVFWMIVAVATVSFLLSRWAAFHTDGTANFYLAPTRAWELFAGSICAFAVRKFGVRTNEWLSLLGLMAIFVSIFAYDESTPFPSAYALLPVAGAMLLIGFAGKETFAARLLSTRMLVGLGLISYSAYLWHQPIFAFVRIHSVEPPSGFLRLALTVLAIALAYLSWRFVELPFRDKNQVSRRTILFCSLAGTATFVAIGAAGLVFHRHYDGLWMARQEPVIQRTFRLINSASPQIDNFGSDPHGRAVLGPCRFNVPQLSLSVSQRLRACRSKFGKGVLIFGDSHAVDLFGETASRFDIPFLIGLTQNGCRPNEDFSYCQYRPLRIFLERDPDVFRKVIFEQGGLYLLRDARGRRAIPQTFLDVPSDGEIVGVVPDEANIGTTLSYLLAISRTVPVLWFGPRAEPQVTLQQLLTKGCQGSYSYRRNQYETFTNLDRFIRGQIAATRDPKLSFLSQNEALKIDLAMDFMTCDVWYWSAGDHFSAAGERRFGARLPASFVD